MADETTTLDPAAASPSGAPVDTALKDFGNLDDIFNKAFPATAPKEGDKTPATDPGTTAPAETPPAVPVSPAATTPEVKDELIPSSLFGETPPPAEKKEIPIPEGLTKPKDIQTWKELRQRLDTSESEASKYKSEATTLREKLETIQPDLLQSRLAETEKVNKALSDRISLVDLKLHPEFQRQFDQPIERERKNAIELAKSAGIESADLERALRMPSGAARTEALDEIVGTIRSASVQAELGAVLKELHTLERNRIGALSDAKGNWERLQEHDKAERHRLIEQEQKQIASIVDDLAKSFADEHKIAFFRKVEGNEKWNADIDEEHRLAIEIATKSKDPRQISGAIRMGVAAPRMYNTILALRKELLKERALNAEFKNADPSLEGSHQPDASDMEQDKNLSFAEAVAKGSGLR